MPSIEKGMGVSAFTTSASKASQMALKGKFTGAMPCDLVRPISTWQVAAFGSSILKDCPTNFQYAWYRTIPLLLCLGAKVSFWISSNVVPNLKLGTVAVAAWENATSWSWATKLVCGLSSSNVAIWVKVTRSPLWPSFWSSPSPSALMIWIVFLMISSTTSATNPSSSPDYLST